MNKKRATVLLCILIVVAGASVVFTSLTFKGKAQEGVGSVQQLRSPLPEHVAYEFLFRRQAFAKQKAEELERQGKNAKDLRSMIKDEAKLTDEQASMFDEIASASLQDAKELDDRANRIIKAAKSRYPGGRIPKGEKPPPVPQELLIMQQRDAIFHHGRARLQVALGDQGFGRLDEFVKREVVNKLR